MQGRIRTQEKIGIRNERNLKLRLVSRFANQPPVLSALCRCLSAVAVFLALTISCLAQAPAPAQTAVDQLKARVASTNPNDRPRLCVEIAEKQLKETDRLYAASDIPGGQAALTDVVAYSELARDYSIQTHKYQKQAEIAVRGMTRKLTEIKHSLGHDDQVPLQDALNRLERVRDELLASLFKRGGK